MNVTRVTHYIEAISQWTGIGLGILAFKNLQAMSAWIFVGCYVVFHIILCFVLSKFDDAYLGKHLAVADKATRSEEQVDDFCHDFVNNEDKHISKEQFDETKKLLMDDWLDTHPGCTRIDFQKFFDHRMQCIVNCALHPYSEESKTKASSR
jgi:hypothetical protein